MIDPDNVASPWRDLVKTHNHRTLAAFFGKAWAMDRHEMAARLEWFRASTAAGPLDGAPMESDLVTRDGSRGILHLRGDIIAGAPEWYAAEFQVADPRAALEALRDLDADPTIDQILLDIESPGGTVAGVHALGEAVRQATTPTRAHITSLGASAAYWIAAQADTVSAEPTAQVGSIGVYTTLPDVSGWLESMGVKIHLIASGPAKGAGAMGTQVTDAHLGAAHERIQALADIFKAEVVAGRGDKVADIEAAATGQVWVAGQAARMGLIDEITELDDLLAGMVPAPAASASVQKGEAMPNPASAQASETEADTTAPDQEPADAETVEDETQEATAPDAEPVEGDSEPEADTEEADPVTDDQALDGPALDKAIDAFGETFAIQARRDHLTLGQARDRFVDHLAKENADLRAQVQALETEKAGLVKERDTMAASLDGEPVGPTADTGAAMAAQPEKKTIPARGLTPGQEAFANSLPLVINKETRN